MTNDLVKWLREQIAEDEQYAGDHPCNCWQTTGQCRMLLDCPARQRAQCEVHRLLVASLAASLECPCDAHGHHWAAEDALGYLALAYQHRPGYREEWKP